MVLKKIKLKNLEISKSQRTTQIIAILLVIIVIIADFTKLGLSLDLEINLEANPTTADVGENIIFNWTIVGDFDSGWINFGDGNVTAYSIANSSINHKYSTEGRYNVTLYAKTTSSTELTDSIIVEIKNNAPQFSISLPNQAYEDELVNISVTNLIESEVDKEPGKLTYVYDFADGNRTSTNTSSILHAWKNAGVYSMIITAIDPQGALSQQLEHITIINSAPEANFTVNTNIPSELLLESYYATFDFQNDLSNLEPKDWNVSDDGNPGEKHTAILRPNGDIYTEWNNDEAPPHWSKMDETSPDGLVVSETVEGYKEEQDYTSFNMGNNIVTKIKVCVYGKIYQYMVLNAYYRIGTGSLSSYKILDFIDGHGYEWKSVTWTGLALTQNDLDNLRIRIVTYFFPYYNGGKGFIDTVYVEITYEPATLIHIVDMGGYTNEVVRINDRSSDFQAWMENSFTNQQYGTIEFWVRSNDATSKTWALSFWEGTTMAFSITMDDDKWKYSTGGGFNEISELGTPADNTWYWIRIDFCVSGTYLDLTASQFKIKVDSIQSNVYSYGSINHINKIRFESGTSDKGMAWIDAVGYIWDPNYDLGDNKIQSIYYPEKSNVNFYADVSSDTESDINSLRFYWQFGDSTTGFGKFIYHEYKQSGIYNVLLTVKDDNGAMDNFSRRILVHNTYPVVDIPGSSINLDEGETLLLNVNSTDEITDWAFLEYYWDFNASEFNPYNVSGYDLGGWRNAYLFKDDFNGLVGVMVRDPEGAFNSDTISITISNVAPHAYIWGAYIVSNITFQVFRNSVSKDANFTFSLVEDNELKSETKLNFSGSSENLVYSEKELTIMDLSRHWEVIVNTSSELPVSSWFKCYVILEFLNGEELIITSDKLYGGSYGYWNVSLNPYWYNPIDYTIRVPVTFNASIWDPSMDDISYTIEYSVSMVMKINCTDDLPLSDSFILGKSLGNVDYTIDVYTSGNDKYANITAIQQFGSGNFEDNVFPVNINFSFTIFPIVDLFELLEIHLDLTELSILGCNESINILEIEVSDDDSGSNEEMIVFFTQDKITFQNLMPRLECFMSEQEIEANNVTLYLEVIDFDQIYAQYGYNVSYFNADDIPTMQDDFNLIEGSSDWDGELTYQNDDYTTFNANFNFDHSDAPSQPSNFTLDKGTSDWSGDLISIDGNYTSFSSEDLGIGYDSVVIRPNGDITTSWNEGASIPHWNKIEEVNPDGVRIAETGSTTGVIDRHSYDDVSIGSATVIQIKLYVYAKVDSGATAYLNAKYEVGSGWSSLKSIGLSSSYAWRSCTWSGLSLTDSQVDALSVALVAYNVVPRYMEPGKVYVDTSYVQITYEMPLGHRLNFTSEFQLELGENIAPKDIEYSYKTNVTQTIDFEIWNFQTSQWDLIDDVNYDSFSSHSWEFSSSYYDENNTVRLSFHGFNSGNSFGFDLEMLKIRSGNHSLQFISVFQMEDINTLEKLKFFKLLYSCKTSYSQQINLSLYNFHSQSWILISSSIVGMVFIRNKHLISNAAFHNSTYHVLVKIEAESLAPGITLFLDQLRLVYYYANSTYQENFFLEYVPEQSDFTISNGTLDSSGDLSTQDNDYTTFSSETIGVPTLDFFAQLHMTNSSSEDYPIYLQLFYSFKSNISTHVNISLYNFITQAWNIIDSVNVSINWYTKIYRVNISSYFNSSFDMLFRIEATNSSDNFQLFLDQLKIDYLFSSFFVTTDFGYESYTQQANPYFEMSSESSTVYETVFTFEYEGEYLITWTVNDEDLLSYNGEVIEIKNITPVAFIGSFPNQTIEDEEIKFSSEITIYGSNSTKNDYRFAWSFGDGLYAYTEDPIHAYAEAGVYNLSLTVVDWYGNTYTDIKNITIIEKIPEIVGPYTFYGVEGQAIILNVSIFDSFIDEIDLEYKWYNSTSLFSTDKRPSIILHDGIYDYVLNVSDNMGQTATANISIIVEDVPPVVLMSNYMYSGINATENEGFFAGTADGAGELELNAYAYDIYDNSEFDYTWTIFRKNINYTTYDYNGGECSTKKFRVTQTGQYRGQVKINTGNKSALISFMINSFIDSNGNGISDETEEMILEFYDNVTSYSDTDDDGLTDLYEIYYNITDYLDPDSDDDELWDGLNYDTGIGEQTAWTDANNPDCDDDLLTDATEVVGWNITLELYGTIVVTSNPWKNDTDGDGISDYDEYYIGTDPRNTDTDNDGLSDPFDPYPLKWDYDGDGLSDKKEYDIGTSLNNTDSDGDGLTDGEEVLGWGFKTDPLTADSDHDFAADNAEMKSHRAEIDDRYDLNEPVNISFNVNCEKASSAQIAFMITFGEAINEEGKEYGIQNVPDINISIYKNDDNLLLFNMTSAEFNQTSEDNMTRYLSRVVDIRETIENLNLDYRGLYSIMINDTEAGCILEQFEIEVAGYLHPQDSDYDNDGIMDGVEMSILVEGTDIIDLKDIYGDSATIEFPREEIGWWTMDEGTGTVANDSSYYENDGILNNMESADWKSGKIGDYALEFDGVNEYINCGDNSYLNFERNQTYTLSAWVKTTSGNGAILSKMNVSDVYKGYDMYCKSDGVIRAHLINTLDSNEIIVDGSTQIDDGEWHFVVITYNGSSSAAGIKIYIDGTLDNPTIIKDTLNMTIQTNVDFMIGSRSGDDYFSGQVDDVRVYYHDLNENEIIWLNNSGNGRSLQTLNITTENSIETQYYIEIPHIGRVYDANLTLKVESVSTPIGNGNITIKLLKEEISNKIDDAVLIDYFSEFDNTTVFTYEKFIDLSDYLNNGSIYQYYGKFVLDIEIHGTYLFDKYIVSEFYIESDTFIQAGPSDTEGWITNPATVDTDNDGWSDYYEIFIKSTNPISADTDGDGVWDSYDRDPKQDVMIEISPIYGRSESKYTFKIVIAFSLTGSDEKFYIPTPKVKAHYNYIEWYAYFDGTHGSSTELHYYANINDDTRIQGNELDFTLQLWRVDRYWGLIKKWDKKLVDSIETYYIDDVGDSRFLYAYDGDSSTKVKVKTIGVEKANTIAIYETNGSVFNGHYQEQERMNVIQLYVNDSGSGTPFEEGLNTIVIPTSLFTETVFNARVQNETLSETPIYSDDEEIFKFISVGRDGNTEQACEEIDFIIIRFDISSADAMEVLNLLLECLVNETTNETAIVYSYVSTKENGTVAVLVNLPVSVLGLIPWYCDFVNSPMGSKPETFEDWFWKPLKTLGKAIVGVILFMGMPIIILVGLIIEFVADILMEWLPILEYILRLIICVLILVFIYILFALNVIITIISFLSTIPILILFSQLIDVNVDIKLNSITLGSNLNFSYGYIFSIKTIELLGFSLPIPVIIQYYTLNDSKYQSENHFFSTEDSTPTNELFDDLVNYNISGIKIKSDYDAKPNELQDIFIGAGEVLEIYGRVMSIVGSILILLDKSAPQYKYIFVVGSLSLLLYVLFSMFNRNIQSGYMNSAYLFGLIIALAIPIAVCGLISCINYNLEGIWKVLKRVLTGYLIYSTLGGTFLEENNIFRALSLENLFKESAFMRGILWIIVGAITLLLVSNSNRYSPRNSFCYAVSTFTFALGAVLSILLMIRLSEESNIPIFTDYY